MATTSWNKIKDGRSQSEERAAGYEAARRAFSVGQTVRAWREEAGLSQAELAKRAHTSQPAIARLEAGGTTPNIASLRAIADALGVDLVVEFKRRSSRSQKMPREVTRKRAAAVASQKVVAGATRDRGTKAAKSSARAAEAGKASKSLLERSQAKAGSR
jgi:transcriptional regulator with XRE-family HTH domain